MYCKDFGPFRLAGSTFYIVTGFFVDSEYAVVIGVSGLIGATTLGVLSEISEDLRNS